MSPSQKRVSLSSHHPEYVQFSAIKGGGDLNSGNMTISVEQMSLNRCQSRFCLFSERSYAYSSRPGEAVDEGALQAVQRSGGRLRAGPRGEDHHLH